MKIKTSSELEGKVSLVTGAYRGIGKAIALKLSSLGFKVAINNMATHC
jgi:NAD(P)-dependent dehydrogenase (short-subunit alcohol dehydrogenase family)